LQKVDSTKVDGDDARIVQVLERMELDGVADLIDKRGLVSTLPLAPNEAANPVVKEILDQYRQFWLSGPNYLRAVDETLRPLNGGNAQAEPVGVALSERMRGAGPAVGMYMADAVERTLGRRRLIETVGNPFAFFRAYQEAAEKAKSPKAIPSFSSETMEVLRTLEAKYISR
jgi:hypothetical protein